MFIREPFKAPPGAKETFEVRYAKGRKPFQTLPEAEAFAQAEADEGRWGDVSRVVTMPLSTHGQRD